MKVQRKAPQRGEPDSSIAVLRTIGIGAELIRVENETLRRVLLDHRNYLPAQLR